MRTSHRIVSVTGFAALAVASALSLRCINDLSLAGSGSSSGNPGIVGTLRNENGVPAEKAIVRLIPANFDPVADYSLINSVCKIDTTDLNGGFSFRNVSAGNYSVEAVRWTDGKRALLQVSAHAAGQTDTAPIGILRNPGVLKIAIPDSADPVYGYLYIPGTTRSALLSDMTGYVMIDSVPVGVVPSINYGVLNRPSVQSIIRYAVLISPGDTAIVLLPSWKYARKLVLNTTSNGANVAGNVYDFPVLVRLSSVNFDFSKAKIDGGDIRFTKKNGEIVAYEIEQWDSMHATAAIWVKMDTVHGNNNTQSVMLYFGNSSAASFSSSVAVFDTACGVCAAWHLNEAGNTVQGGYRDASAEKNHLTAAGASPSEPGVIGNARCFNATPDYLSGPVPSKLGGATDFSIISWIKTGTMQQENTETNRVDVLDFGRKNQTKGVFHLLLWPNYTTQFGFDDLFAPVGSCPDSTTKVAQNVFDFSRYAGTWTWVAVTYDVSSGMLSTYINGSIADADSASGATIINAGGLRMGQPYFAGDAEFCGSLDEVRLYNRALSGPEIQLNFEIQKPAAGCIRME